MIYQLKKGKVMENYPRESNKKHLNESKKLMVHAESLIRLKRKM